MDDTKLPFVPFRSIALWISANATGPVLDTEAGLVLDGATLTDSGARPVNIRHELANLSTNIDGGPPVLSSDTSRATVNGVRLQLIYRSATPPLNHRADWLDTRFDAGGTGTLTSP